MGTETCECGRLFPNMPIDYWAHRTTCMYARIYDLKADKSKLLLQIGEYRMALEKILRLKDATPSTALDAVWIAKDALLGTNHMEKPFDDLRPIKLPETPGTIPFVDRDKRKDEGGNPWAPNLDVPAPKPYQRGDDVSDDAMMG